MAKKIFLRINKMSKILCKTCFHRWRADKKDWCGLIVKSDGSSFKANKTKCEHYLKKGTEPQWLCCICGKNTYGQSARGSGGKWYCEGCYWKKEEKEWKKQKVLRERQDIKKVAELVGNKKLAKKIIETIKSGRYTQ